MARSRYDRNHDGRCDAAVCQGVRALSLPAFAPMADEIRRNLSAIGINVRVETPSEPSRVFALLADPKQQIPLALDIGYGKDDLNGAGLFPPSFARSGIGNGNNVSLVGARPAELRRWGYTVTHVPNVDARIDECQALFAGPQIECWTSLDQYLMEQVVPWVPIAEETHVDIVGRRVARFSFDQLSTVPALERIALRR
jgi:ABC-type transport system substrate-binding protein